MNAPVTAVAVSNAPELQQLLITGMHCASCVGRVEQALRSVPGVASASVNLATERAVVGLTADVPRAALAAAVMAAGYRVPDQTFTLSLDGMTCASCVARVEASLMAVPGVTTASVNLVREEAQVEGQAEIADLIAAVAQAGFHATPTGRARDDGHQLRKDDQQRRLVRDVWIAAALTVPVVALDMGGHLLPAVHDLIHTTIGMGTARVIQCVLTLAVLAGPGRRFFVAGGPALWHARPDMNALVMLGAGAAFAVSVVATFLPGILPGGMDQVYFEPAAVIVTLVLFGRSLEARAKGRAARAIKALIGLQPATARIRRGADVADVPITHLRVGDLVDLRPGERVPADGTVTEGESWIDASMMTGEPLPVAAGVGSALVGGTVNQSGALTLRVTATGAASVLSQIIRMVEDAQGGKLPVQALVDRVTMWFVPAVLVLAAATALVWLMFGPAPAPAYALVNAVAVLIIACPCAMGLATPMSILAGTGRGAELGILFRRGEALQRLSEVRVVAFDKTGTLTMGRPGLTDTHLMPGVERAALLSAVAAVEAKSEHPVARALVAAARDAGIVVPLALQVVAQPGLGVSGQVGGQAVIIGSAQFMIRKGVDITALADHADRLAAEGKTPLHVAIDAALVAVLAVADEIRPGAEQAVRALQARGLHVVMISGDAHGAASAVAQSLGIDDVVADVLPGAKRDAVRGLRDRHGPIAFVGDGINDAPALAEADVGIAIGTGTAVAVEAADVVLMSGNPAAVPVAIGLSGATMTNIRQNLFWAFGYNVALIPVAAGVLYPGFGILLSPALAAGAMALSSLFVVGNALRLSRFAAPDIQGGSR